MKEYYCSFTANSTTAGSGYCFSNKKKAISYIREVAEGNVFAGGNCRWTVVDHGNRIVASGGSISGRRFREI